MSAADLDRSRVYTAEEAAFGGTLAAEALPWARFEDLAGALLGALRAAGVDLGPVALQPSRPESGHSSARTTAAGAVIRVAPGHEAAATLTHELAHLVAGLAEGHGPAFRAAHVGVAGIGLGERGAAVLAGEYRRHGLGLPAAGPPAPAPLPGWGLLARLLDATALPPPSASRAGRP